MPLLAVVIALAVLMLALVVLANRRRRGGRGDWDVQQAATRSASVRKDAGKAAAAQRLRSNTSGPFS